MVVLLRRSSDRIVCERWRTRVYGLGRLLWVHGHKKDEMIAGSQYRMERGSVLTFHFLRAC